MYNTQVWTEEVTKAYYQHTHLPLKGEVCFRQGQEGDIAYLYTPHGLVRAERLYTNCWYLPTECLLPPRYMEPTP